MKISITGASGFVGQNLSRFFLSRSYKVKMVSLRDEDWKESLEGDAIIHLAGKAHDTSNSSQPAEYFKVNRDLTINLFDEFLKSDMRDFFYFSSVKAVADSVVGVLDEERVANPLTPYGRSKLEAEKYLISQEIPPTKRLFIIRPCMIHGPGNKGNLNLLYRIVKRGIPWPLGAFDNRRSFLSVDNLNFLLEEMLLKKTVTSGIYNFADDDTVSTNELVALISECLNKKTISWHIPTALVHKMATIGNVLRLPLNSERLKKLVESYEVSNMKIKGALGINRLPNDVKSGLKKTIRSFEKSHS